jgi:hypothetical protein
VATPHTVMGAMITGLKRANVGVTCVLPTISSWFPIFRTTTGIWTTTKCVAMTELEMGARMVSPALRHTELRPQLFGYKMATCRFKYSWVVLLPAQEARYLDRETP